jgi:Transcriptional Coactivator p15 (PC4)
MAPKKYVIGENRYLVIKKDEIKMSENGTSKIALFTYARWAHFAEYFADIDSAVAQLMSGQPDIKLRLHVGSGWCVSVTSGYRYIDIRKFYVLPGVGERPTKSGLALRLHEWARLKEVASEIKEDHPDVAAVQPC